MNPRTLIITALLAGQLTACSFTPEPGPDSVFYSPPVGSQLRLNVAITIPAHDTDIYIQDGKVQSSYWSVDAYYPHCNFELRTRTAVARQVEPDTFIITRVVRDIENVLLNNPVRVAGFGSGDTAPPHEDYMVIMDLRSDTQSDVMRMTCQHWEDPNEGNHLTINEMRKALGKLFTLTLASNKR